MSVGNPFYLSQEQFDNPDYEYRECGAVGPGWYFWDETWAHCHGPYDALSSAQKALRQYAQTLDRPKSRVREQLAAKLHALIERAHAEYTNEDLLFLTWASKDKPSTHGVEIAPGVILRFTDDNDVVGVTVYDCSRLSTTAALAAAQRGKGVSVLTYPKLVKPTPPKNLVLKEHQQPPKPPKGMQPVEGQPGVYEVPRSTSVFAGVTGDLCQYCGGYYKHKPGCQWGSK